MFTLPTFGRSISFYVFSSVCLRFQHLTTSITPPHEQAFPLNTTTNVRYQVIVVVFLRFQYVVDTFPATNSNGHCTCVPLSVPPQLPTDPSMAQMPRVKRMHLFFTFPGPFCLRFQHPTAHFFYVSSSVCSYVFNTRPLRFVYVPSSVLFSTFSTFLTFSKTQS